MKRRNLFLFAIILAGTLLAGLLFTSCQRETSEDIDRPTDNDSIYLSMSVSFDTTYPSGLDTVYKSIYTYDAQKRISSIVSYEYFAGDPTPYGPSEWKWVYQGNDTLPYKLESNDNDTTFFIYQNGVVIKDSSVIRIPGIWIDTRVNSYTQLGSNRYMTVRKRYNSGVILETDTVYSTVVRNSNGNITSEKDTVHMGGIVSTYEIQRTFDDKPNPFHRFGIPNWVLYNGQTTWVGDAPFNNILSEYWHTSASIGGADEVTTQMSYRYRSDGYPLILWEEDDLGQFYKEVHFYTRL